MYTGNTSALCLGFPSQRGIGHYTWLAWKIDISEEVRSHRSNVISRLFVVPRPPTD